MTPHCKLLFTATMFLTRLPVGNTTSAEPDDLAHSTQYFPLVGLVVGILVSATYLVASLLWLPELSIALSITVAVLLTGAFHEDGLADFADSAGVWSKQRKLDVMRDSRVGTFGALALIFIVLLKVIALSSIVTAKTPIDSAVNSPQSWIVASLILAHVLGRWSSLPLIRFSSYAREDSANKILAEGVTTPRLLIGSLITLVVTAGCFVVLGIAVVYSLFVACAAVLISRWQYQRSIGGITGDCLGATNQVVELLVYLSVASTVR